MKAVCPKSDKHKRFYTTAHIVQEWEVDERGNFHDVVTDCCQVAHFPDAGNMWVCAVCGTEAKVIETEDD